MVTELKNFTIIPDYFNSNLKEYFLEKALSHWEQKSVYMQSCGKRGYFNINEKYPEELPQIENILENIMFCLNVPKERYLPARHFIGINLPTAFVTPHKDKIQFVKESNLDTNGWVEVRFNTFLQKPFGGGIPVIENTPVSLNENEAVAFRANIEHSSTPVEGDIIRVMFSIGSVVHPEYTVFLDKI